jgi:hypothetical protein
MNQPLPPEALSKERYAAMNTVAPRGGDTSFRDMARHTAYAPNRVAALADVRPDPAVQHAEAGVPMQPNSYDPQRAEAEASAARNRTAEMFSGGPNHSWEQPVSSADFLASRYGQQPGVSPAQAPKMADTPMLHEPMSAGGPMTEGMAMSSLPPGEGPMMTAMPGAANSFDSGLGSMFSNAVMSPEMMGGGFGGMDLSALDFGGGFGGMDFGSGGFV